MPGLIVLLLTALALLVLLTVGLIVAIILDPPRRAAGYAVARGLPVDPADLNLPFEEWTLDLPDGAHLPVWDVRTPEATVANSDAPTVVMIHEWGASRIDSLSQARQWLAVTPRIVMYDLRGHGEATPRRGPGRTRMGRNEHRDLLDLLDRLAGSAPRSASFVLVGASMGATIALQAAAELTVPTNTDDPEPAPATPDASTPMRIERIIAVSPSPDPADVIARRLRARALPGRPLAALVTAALTLLGRRPLGGPALRDTARQVRCPVTIVHGADDPLVPIEGVRRLCDALPDGELIEVSGAAHHDQALFDRVGAFLRTGSASRGRL